MGEKRSNFCFGAYYYLTEGSYNVHLSLSLSHWYLESSLYNTSCFFDDIYVFYLSNLLVFIVHWPFCYSFCPHAQRDDHCGYMYRRHKQSISVACIDDIGKSGGNGVASEPSCSFESRGVVGANGNGCGYIVDGRLTDSLLKWSKQDILEFTSSSSSQKNARCAVRAQFKIWKKW